MESTTTLVTFEKFQETLSLLLCECVATAGELSPFEITAKVSETTEGARVLVWTLRKATILESLRAIIECANGKPIATLTGVKVRPSGNHRSGI